MLSDLFKDRLSATDDVLLAALKALFNEQQEKLRPRIFEEDNKLIGEKYRAYMESQKLAESIFQEINLYRVKKTQPKNFNKEI